MQGGEVQLDAYARSGCLGEQAVVFGVGNGVQHFDVVIPVDQAAGQVGDANLVEGQIHVQHGVKPVAPQLCPFFHTFVTPYGKSAHVHVGGGDDDEGQLFHHFRGNAHGAVHILVGFAAEEEIHVRGLGQGQGFAGAFKGLLGVPAGCTGHSGIPHVVGEADGLQIVVFGVLQNGLGGLGRVVRAEGKLGMNV